MDHSRQLIPSAPVLWASTIGWVLVNDAILVAQGRETMSGWYQRNWWKLALVTGYLLFHLHGRPRRWARFDPLHRGANVIRSRVVRVTPTVAFETVTWDDGNALHIEAVAHHSDAVLSTY